MSARAIRARVSDAAGAGGVPAVTLLGWMDLGFLTPGAETLDSCRTNQSLKVSSETPTPNCTSAPTMIRIDVPAARSFMRTPRCWLSASVLDFRPALAWAISWEKVGESMGEDAGMTGKSLGKSWASNGDSQGKHRGPAGEKSKQKSLDVGVSLKWLGVVC